jgi:hypothetical protein
VELSLERLARNQALFREVNERINEIRAPAAAFTEYVCECSNPGCTETLAVRAGEYEAVRSHATRFLVARGHELTEVERIVEDSGRFLTVAKTVETEFIADVDPRSDGG